MKTRRQLEPSPLQLIEEAVHLLRRAPAATLAVYYAGTVPCVLAGLFFWAHTTWFQPSAEEVAWGALGLVVLYAVMKTAQAAFCARLLADRLGAAPPAWTRRKWRHVAVAQLRVQPWALVASALALIVALPFGWVCAYAQNLTVLGEAERLHDDAVEQAKLWPGQNHGGLLLISVLAVGVWVNLAAGFVAVPWLANRLLGIDNMFGFSGWWFFNTTFVASVSALTWLAVDPLVKAFYTLRVFHGRARRTGEDVRVDLQLARRGAAAGLRVAAIVAVVAMWGGVQDGALRAQEAPALAPTRSVPTANGLPATAAPAVHVAELDRAIDGVLDGPEFRWRLRPDPSVGEAKADGPIGRFLRQGAETLGEMARSVGRWLSDVVDWFERRFSRDSDSGRKSANAGAAALSLVRLLLYIFIGVAIVLILWLIYLLIRGAARRGTPVLAAQAVATATPDLRDENVQAAQLPADGWLALAREQMERGEWRLALRALYLATLARLAMEGLVSLAKFKTNLDYEREVRRRALSRAGIAQGFALRRRQFEDVWYGRAQPGEAEVRAWMAELAKQ